MVVSSFGHRYGLESGADYDENNESQGESPS